jgi:hypothetical protein
MKQKDEVKAMTNKMADDIRIWKEFVILHQCYKHDPRIYKEVLILHKFYKCDLGFYEVLILHKFYKYALQICK